MHIKHFLQLEQKRTDFKSELDEISNQCTSACSKTIKIIENQIAKINMCLDGRNINSALKELGIKFHRCIYDHIFSFQYNELGLMFQIFRIFYDVEVIFKCIIIQAQWL
jgi:hypothetical protein